MEEGFEELGEDCLLVGPFWVGARGGEDVEDDVEGESDGFDGRCEEGVEGFEGLAG